MNTLFYRNGRERQQLQDCENSVQSERAPLTGGEAEDTVDFCVASDLKISLEKVSKAIYGKFISDWHGPPEELQNQPLYKEISCGIQSVFFNLKSRTRPLEEYEIIISITTGLLTHFKNKRGKKVTYRFKTRQEEVDFLRKHIRCLLDYWLPESMQSSRLIYVFLTEILSVNVLEQIINNFSDFTYINETIVAALDDEPVTQQKEDSGRCDEMKLDIGCKESDDSNTVMESDSTISRKKKKKRGIRRIRQKCAELFKSNRSRKPECEDGTEFRAYCSPVRLNSDVDVADMGCCDDSEGDENSLLSVIDTSLQMWLQSNWTAKVSERLAEKDEYEISVYDESAPGTVLWNTRRCMEDFKLIHEKLYQKYPDMTKPEEAAAERPIRDGDRQFLYSIGVSPAEFINKLLNLIKIHQEADAVFFFSPFEYDDKEFLECLPNSDVTDTDEEDFSVRVSADDGSTGDSTSSEMDFDDDSIQFRAYRVHKKGGKSKKDSKPTSSDLQDTSGVGAERNMQSKRDEETIVESRDKETDSTAGYQTDGSNWLRSRGKHKKNKKVSCNERQALPNNLVARDEQYTEKNAYMRSEGSNIQQRRQMSMDSNNVIPLQQTQTSLDLTDRNMAQTKEQEKQRLQEDLLDVLYQLIDEVLEGGKSRVCFLHRIGVLKSVSKYILKSIPNIYAEEQIVWYLNQVAELLTSQVPPLQLTPDVLQTKALKILNNKVQGLLTNYFLKTFFKKQILNHLKTSHRDLQDTMANKATIYGLLEDLTKIITNEVGISVH
ncbi:uncharacterized protein [Eleutherodactylus coqui]|uniref:uncharacterized protein isoform X2 n=1 Tax=Eleutherodactylus coqui TaxID=57060 RepID=UPI0034623259